MTDEQIADIYAMGRDSFTGGQRKFQVQAFPFRMTAINMAKNAGSEHYEFWKMLKRGSDHFAITKRPPAIEVCNKQYVFDAKIDKRGDKFDATGACPAYTVPENIALAVAKKQNTDARETAATLIAMETTKRRKQKIASFFGGASTTDAAAKQTPNATLVNVEAAKVLALTPEQSSPAPKKASENDRAFSYFTSLFSNSRVSEEKNIIAEVNGPLPAAPAPRVKPQ